MLAPTAQQDPAQLYQQAVDQGRIQYDASQQQAIGALSQLFHALTSAHHAGSQHQGLYLWGQVGRGKTFLMDLFCQSLAGRTVWRIHFHRFMAWVHQRLRHHTGRRDPLKRIARDIARQYAVLCFDELFVSDIGDAMLLGVLFQQLFENRVTLIATSNIPIESLYRDGLQRERFLPAIQALQQNTRSLHLDGQRDHRTRNLQRTPIYFFKLPGTLLQALALPELSLTDDAIEVLGRKIPIRGASERSLHCSFAQLCEGNRSHLDYIELAKRYSDVVLTDIPPLSGQSYERIKARGTEEATLTVTSTGAREIRLARKDDAVRRFITLVDEFYERRVNLYLVSQTPLASLYTQGSLLFEFQRTLSRLTEMASQEYQQLAHKP